MFDSRFPYMSPLYPEAGEASGAMAAAGSAEDTEPLTRLIRQAVEEKASDIHLRAGSPPRLRIDGELLKIKYIPSDQLLRRFFHQMLTREQSTQFDRTHELDFSHSVAGLCRVRVNLYMERNRRRVNDPQYQQ